jgi:hypothetical protein
MISRDSSYAITLLPYNMSEEETISYAPESLTVPAPLMSLVVLLLNDINIIW